MTTLALGLPFATEGVTSDAGGAEKPWRRPVILPLDQLQNVRWVIGVAHYWDTSEHWQAPPPPSTQEDWPSQVPRQLGGPSIKPQTAKISTFLQMQAVPPVSGAHAKFWSPQVPSQAGTVALVKREEEETAGSREWLARTACSCGSRRAGASRTGRSSATSRAAPPRGTWRCNRETRW